MKPASDTILRQWFLLRFIPREPNAIGTAELTRKLRDEGYRMDVRTIQRDLEKLCTLFPLTCSTQGKANRWFWPKEAQVMDLPGMDPPTALAFRLAEEHLLPLLPRTTLKYLEPHFRRARALLEPTAQSSLGLWPDKVYRVGRGPHLPPPPIAPEVHDAVCQALLHGKQLTLRYRAKEAQETKTYPVHPLGLVFREGLVYLVCTVKDYTDPRHLPLHRMLSAKVQDEMARRPAKFDLRAYVEEQAELAYPVTRERVRLRALFEAQAAFHLSERPLAKDQQLKPQPDGRVLLTATVQETLELRWWLLGFGEKVEVLEPASLRKEFAAVAQRMAAAYEKM
jgi:predicted DNA-binding transcriptional regulator YafY